MEQTKEWPLWMKMSVVMMGLVAFFYVMYIGQDILLPLVFSVIIGILLNPVVNKLCDKGCNRVLAILLSLLLAFLVVAGLFYFLGSQISMFGEALPELKLKLKQLLSDLLNWVSQKFNVPKSDITKWIQEKKDSGMGKAESVVTNTASAIANMLVLVFLLPVYIFLILFYKPLFLNFLAKTFGSDSHEKVKDVLTQTKTLIQAYLTGLMIECGIVATLNSVGLLIIGVDYAILLGVIGALLNLIPYIGGLVAISLPMIIALATQSPSTALLVLVVYVIVQFIDNNLIVPKIVGSKVKINAFISIVVVLIGGALWGVGGMFLSIPLTAILKVICDRIEGLEPIGYLIGDDVPAIGDRFFKLGKK